MPGRGAALENLDDEWEWPHRRRSNGGRRWAFLDRMLERLIRKR